MAKVKIEIEVSKEIYEAGQGIGKFLMNVKTQLADGWQTDKDLGVILGSAMGDLVPGLQGIDQAGSEYSEDPAAAVEAALQGLKPFVKALLEKKPAA